MANAAAVAAGTTADELLTLVGRSKGDFLCPPCQTGRDELGLIVEWAYEDCTVVLKRLTLPGDYEVVEVRPRESKEAGA